MLFLMISLCNITGRRTLGQASDTNDTCDRQHRTHCNNVPCESTTKQTCGTPFSQMEMVHPEGVMTNLVIMYNYRCNEQVQQQRLSTPFTSDSHCCYVMELIPIGLAYRKLSNNHFLHHSIAIFHKIQALDWHTQQLSIHRIGRTRQTLWSAVQMLTQKLCCQTIHDCPKVVPLHYESE